MDKIINEFRVIETDDGFRIEIKGDKEKIKAFMSGFARHKRSPGWHGHAGPFPFPFGPWMWMRAASCCGEWDFEAEEEETGESSKA